MVPLLLSRRQAKSLPLRCLRWVLGITWQDLITNKGVLAQERISSMFCYADPETTALAGPHPRHRQWLHSKGCSTWWVGLWLQTYEMVCTVSMTWGLSDRQHRSSRPGNSILRPHHLIVHHEGWHRRSRTEERGRMGRLQAQETAETTLSTRSTQASMFTCSNCSRPCVSRIVLYSHSRCCNSITD